MCNAPVRRMESYLRKLLIGDKTQTKSFGKHYKSTVLIQTCDFVG